jgi:2,4-dienoyl-CoA reductase-like NADH-dependent reductase (Old Yellow Enzyme family)/thioredoxin reductase
MDANSKTLYPRLFSAGQIGTLSVPNRIVMPPMLTCLADGRYVSQRLINYLAARAQGGTGLVMMEFATVDPLGPIVPNQVGLYDDTCIPGLQKLVEAVHKHGSNVAIQLGHGGHRAWSKYIGAQPVSASDVTGRGGEKPRPLTLDEIRRLIESFVSAAQRVKKAGFDGAEIHCAHGYLIRQFLSPYTNKRTDQYGGDLAGRARLAREVVESVRQAVGTYPMWVRVNGDDFVERGGLTQEESRTVCQWLEKAGANAISVSGSTYESLVNWGLAPMFVPRGILLQLAEATRKIVHVPVIAVGRIDTPEFAEQVLKDEKADFVAIGRALIADPDFAVKAKQGRASEIRRCIADNVCIDSLSPETRLHCTVNPEVGREQECSITAASKPRKVVVIGGGPAGMETARVAALRGHRVTLLEKEGCLGGQINVASKGNYKEDLNLVTSYLAGQITKMGVDIRLNTPADSSLIKGLNPDAVVMASGSEPVIPPIPGIEQAKVFTAREALLSQKEMAGDIVIVGGGRVGIEVAEFVKTDNNEVTVIEMLGRIGGDLGESVRFPSITRLKELGIKIMANTRVEKVARTTITVNDAGKMKELDTDIIILATGAKSCDKVCDLAGINTEKYCIGDCKKPRNILEAISEGSDLGRSL